jgi:hypothetical protein
MDIESSGRYFASTGRGRSFALFESEPGQLSAVRRDFKLNFCLRSDKVAYDVVISKGDGKGMALARLAGQKQ